jgi:hypothetical protein
MQNSIDDDGVFVLRVDQQAIHIEKTCPYGRESGRFPLEPNECADAIDRTHIF